MSFPRHLLFHPSEPLFKFFKASNELRWSWQGTGLPTSAFPLPLVLLPPHLAGALDREALGPGSSFLWLENWAMVGYSKLNTAEYWEDRNNYNCWGGRSCTAPSMKRTTAVQKIYRDTPHPPPAKANRGDLHLSEGWVLVPAEIWAIKCIFFLSFHQHDWIASSSTEVLFYLFFFLISEYLWKRYQNSYRKILYTPNLQVLR